MLEKCSSLAALDLGNNDIGAEGARSLAGGLGQCSSLARLDLSGNDIGEEGTALIRTCVRDTVALLANV